LADVPMWKAGPFSAYGWRDHYRAFCILLALIFSSSRP